MWDTSSIMGADSFSQFRMPGTGLKWIALWILIACSELVAAAEPGTQKSSPAPVAEAAQKTRSARRIDWDVLLPKSERAHYNEEPPAPVHDYLGENGKGARQSGSIAVNSQLDQMLVKIPGFVVPLVQDDTGLVSVFFLVPYFGACIHVPPPPPNQIVYVKLDGGGVRLGSPEEPYWITGILHTDTNGTRVAKAAYTLDATRMERYKY
jgi:uncharacterized protein